MISQRVHIATNLKGDGVATTFVFDLDRVYGLNYEGPPTRVSTGATSIPILIDHRKIPGGVAVDYTNPSQGAVTAAISGRTITITFPAAPAASEFAVGLSLIFNG